MDFPRRLQDVPLVFQTTPLEDALDDIVGMAVSGELGRSRNDVI